MRLSHPKQYITQKTNKKGFCASPPHLIKLMRHARTFSPDVPKDYQPQ